MFEHSTHVTLAVVVAMIDAVEVWNVVVTAVGVMVDEEVAAVVVCLHSAAEMSVSTVALQGSCSLAVVHVFFEQEAHLRLKMKSVLTSWRETMKRNHTVVDTAVSRWSCWVAFW